MNMSKQPINPNAISRIAKGTSIIGGNITSDCDIRFDGSYTGDIASKARVIIGETACIKGKITCENLDIWGNLEGDVTVKNTMTVKANAQYKGNISSGRLVIELGARFEGANTILKDAPKA